MGTLSTAQAAAVVEAGGSLAVRDDDGCLPYEAAYTGECSLCRSPPS